MTRLEILSLVVRLGRREVVRDVSLDLRGGELVGLAGPNGAGKTSLLRAVAGLVGSAIGDVRLDGMDLRAMKARQRARHIAYLPQQQAVSWPLASSDIVMQGRFARRSPFAAPSVVDRRAVELALRQSDALAFASRPVTALSGGERARVLLARALAQEAPVLLADEPTRDLDPAHQIGVLELLKAIAGRGTLVVVSLHDLPLATRWCDRIVLMDRGRVVADGLPDQTLSRERLAEVYGVEAEFLEIGGRRIVLPIRRSGNFSTENQKDGQVA
ncbi:MAG: ABC transporter ATP-binding protein [Parvibaculaceae bacterium]